MNVNTLHNDATLFLIVMESDLSQGDISQMSISSRFFGTLADMFHDNGSSNPKHLIQFIADGHTDVGYGFTTDNRLCSVGVSQETAIEGAITYASNHLSDEEVDLVRKALTGGPMSNVDKDDLRHRAGMNDK